MFVLPMRPQPPGLPNNNDSCETASTSLSTDRILPLISRAPAETAGAMISTIPSITPNVSKRPKLSLKTSISSLGNEDAAESTTSLCAIADASTYTRNYVDALDAASPSVPKIIPQTLEPSTPMLSNVPPSLPSSASSSVSSFSSGQTSPLFISAPYSLPLGSRSILRNSPLPRPYLSATSNRAPRRMFPPVKRVLFCELLEEIIPGQALQALSEASDSENIGKRPRDSPIHNHARRSTTVEEDEQSTPVHGRRKRQREWIWRPVEDDILASNRIDKHPTIEDSNNTPTTKEMIEPLHAGDHKSPSPESLIGNTEITRNHTSPRHGSEPPVRNHPLAADTLYPCLMHETQCNSDITAANLQSAETSSKADTVPP